MITVVGAGFSGLTLAYHLRKRGLSVQMFEKQERAGGMIGTSHSGPDLAESAANAILADIEIERLFEDLNVPFAEQKPERKKRYIFWEKPSRWPLTVLTSAKLLWLMGQVRLSSPEVMPNAGETIHDWARRVVNAEFEERLLSPALQGVFAGDPKLLSATLTLSALFGGRAPAGKLKGSVAPEKGMNQLIQALKNRLAAEGVPMHFSADFDLKDFAGRPVVLATPAWTAAELTQETRPELSEQLRHCESLPLVSATAVFEKSASDLQGFGCLFPPPQGFQASGAVFNDCIFEGRSNRRSETWIFGGALNLAAVKWSDDEIRAHILKDRARLMPGAKQEPFELKISRWPRAIPHYTVQWEKFLQTLKAERPLYLHGNYLGVIGLSRIHRRSIQLAEQLKDTYGA
jgi:oxygen-dependent protoporphyrinogen oxidase